MQMFDLLVKHGAEASAPPSEFSRGRTALQAAVAGKHIEAVRKLLKLGGDPNMTLPEPDDDDFLYPLWESILHHHHGLTKLLLNNGANPSNITGRNNPLALAIRTRQLQTVQLLISHGADMNALDLPNFESMLQVAATNESTSIFRFLIEAGADLKGAMGTAVLHAAVGYRQIEIIKYLFSEGVNPNWNDGPRPENCVRLCSPISRTFMK